MFYYRSPNWEMMEKLPIEIKQLKLKNSLIYISKIILIQSGLRYMYGVYSEPI